MSQENNVQVENKVIDLKTLVSKSDFEKLTLAELYVLAAQFASFNSKQMDFWIQVKKSKEAAEKKAQAEQIKLAKEKEALEAEKALMLVYADSNSEYEMNVRVTNPTFGIKDSDGKAKSKYISFKNAYLMTIGKALLIEGEEALENAILEAAKAITESRKANNLKKAS